MMSERENAATDDRRYWLELIDKIAAPVLENMSRATLHQKMPIEVGPIWDNRDKRVAYMEAFGRLIAGVAPFVSLPDDSSPEGKIRHRMREQLIASIKNGFDPASPDYLYWGSPQARQILGGARGTYGEPAATEPRRRGHQVGAVAEFHGDHETGRHRESRSGQLGQGRGLVAHHCRSPAGRLSP